MPARTRLLTTDSIAPTSMLTPTSIPPVRIQPIIPLELPPLSLLHLLAILSILPKHIPLMGWRILILVLGLELIQLALVGTRNRARAAALAVDDVVALALLALALLALHLVHLLRVAVAVERQDVQAGKISGDVGFEQRQELGVGSVSAGVVVDDELVVAGIFRRVLFGRATVNFFGRVGWVVVVRRRVGLGGALCWLWGWRASGVLQATDEEFARKGDVH